MSWLALLLITKISITALFVALPFLFGPKNMLEATTGVSAEKTIFFRLYGVAIAALLVGYGFGIASAENRQFPWGVVAMGIVSNVGAAFLLLQSSKPGSTSFRLGVFFALVTVALVISASAPDQALSKAW